VTGVESVRPVLWVHARNPNPSTRSFLRTDQLDVLLGRPGVQILAAQGGRHQVGKTDSGVQANTGAPSAATRADRLGL